MTAVLTTHSHSMYNNRYKKQLLDKINRLTHTEHDEIFKIMKSHNIPFTENKNGTFFNLTMVSDSIIQQLEKFVEFCYTNKKELDEYDKKINECKLNNNFTSIGRKESMMLNEMVPSLDKISQQNSMGLGAVIASATEKAQREEKVAMMLMEMKKNEKVNTFINILEENLDKIHKKKSNVKFLNAKKRYSKKVVSDKKFEGDLLGTLETEPYL